MWAPAEDRHHAECLQLLGAHPGPLLVPVLVVTDVAYLVESRLGSDTEVRFLGDLAASDLLAEPISVGASLRITELVALYRVPLLETVDASVVAAAGRGNEMGPSVC